MFAFGLRLFASVRVPPNPLGVSPPFRSRKNPGNKLRPALALLHCLSQLPSSSLLRRLYLFPPAAMTELEKCMEHLIIIFHRYTDGDGKTMGKKQLKKLLETELPNFSKTQKNPHLVDCLMKDLDANKDDRLDFEEFLPLVAGLSMACEKCYTKKNTKH